MSLIEPFLILLIAHLIGDFVLQTEQMALKKGHQLPWLAYHAFQLGAITWVLCWQWEAWPIVVVVFLTHLIFDSIKPRLPGSQLKWYIWDQVGHLLVLWFCAYWMIEYFGIRSMPLTTLVPFNVQVIIAAYLFMGRPVTVGVGLFLKPWRDEVLKADKEIAGSPVTELSSSGEWVGNLERFLTLTCVLADQYLPIAGILIAKAIVRYHPTPQNSHRTRMDYVLIGTFSSVGFAIAIGVLARWVMDHVVFLSN